MSTLRTETVRWGRARYVERDAAERVRITVETRRLFQELAATVSDTECARIRERIVQANCAAVLRLVEQHRAYDWCADDLEHLAHAALVSAVEAFHDHQLDFLSFALPAIWGQIDGVSDMRAPSAGGAGEQSNRAGRLLRSGPHMRVLDR